MFKEDVDCVEDLLKPANRVIKAGKEIKYETLERRIGLWNEIKENYDRYLDGKCGKFLKDLDMHFRSQFEVALLILASSFRDNGEEFRPAERFSSAEIEAYERIERYNVFEIMGIDDIRKKIVLKDEKLLELFRDYFHMDRWVEKTLEDPSLKLPLRYYLKKRWDGYKKKVNEAMSSLIKELDWFRRVVSEWEKDAESTSRAVEEKVREIEELKAKVVTREEEIKAKEEGVLTKEEEIRAKEEMLKVKEDEIKKAFEELKTVKDKASRFVSAGEAKQYELNFIGRIEKKLAEEVELFGKKFKVKDLKELKEIDTSRFVGWRSKYGILSERDAKNLPENRHILAWLEERKLLRKEQYILKAAFVSRVEKYAENGFDTDPLELEDVNVYLVDARDKAKDLNKPIVLCIASPTGFEKAVRQHISGEEFHKNFLSRYLSVCLLDLETGELIYNPHDEVAREFSRIFEIEMDEEKISRAKKGIEEEMKMKGWITFKDALKYGNERTVKAAFYRIAEEKGWQIRFVEGVGLVLMK